MRIIVINEESDLKALDLQLFGAEGRAGGAGLDALKRLNPHIDFHKINAGTVLLIPELPGLKAGASKPVTSDGFDTFALQIREALDRATEQVLRGHEARMTEQDRLKTILGSSAFLKALPRDDQLKAQLQTQLESADKVFDQDRDAAARASNMMEQLKEQSAEELAALAKLLG